MKRLEALMVMNETPTEKSPTFEEAMAELEGLVRKMENGNLALEESVLAYSRGMELVRLCRDKLDDAEARVNNLEAQDGQASATAQQK